MPVGAGAATAVAVRAPPAAAGAASAPPPAERGLALARAFEQVRGDSALVLGDRFAGIGRGGRDLLDGLGGITRVGGGSVGCRGCVVAVVALHGEAERLAALAAALEQVFGNLGHELFASFRA